MTTLTITKSLPLAKQQALEHLVKLKTQRFHQDPPLTRAQIEKATLWLQRTYPKAFSKRYNKPLALGIHKEIFADQGEALPFTKGLVRRAIGFYVGHPMYLRALCKATHRHTLQGLPSVPLDPEHIAYTQKILTLRKEKKQNKKSGGSVKKDQEKIEKRK